MIKIETNKIVHDLKWLFDDAITLYQMNRKFSAILLLLCAIDALAKRQEPGNKNVGERFENFLRNKMRREGRSQIHNIYVPQKDKLYTFEFLIYKFLRNPIIHEGAQLELDSQDNYTVCIDWDDLPNGVKVDSENNRVILGGELVFNILADAAYEGLLAI